LIVPSNPAVKTNPDARCARFERNLDSQAELESRPEVGRSGRGSRQERAELQTDRVNCEVELASLRLEPPEPSIEKKRAKLDAAGDDAPRS
jgi:hypothetical protein